MRPRVISGILGSSYRGLMCRILRELASRRRELSRQARLEARLTLEDVADVSFYVHRLAIKRNGALYLLAARYDDSTTPTGKTDASSTSQPKPRTSPESSYLSSSHVSPSLLPTTRRDSATHEVLKSGGSGHFERLVELGESAKGAKIKAIYDGRALNITVTKRGR